MAGMAGLFGDVPLPPPMAADNANMLTLASIGVSPGEAAALRYERRQRIHRDSADSSNTSSLELRTSTSEQGGTADDSGEMSSGSVSDSGTIDSGTISRSST